MQVGGRNCLTSEPSFSIILRPGEPVTKGTPGVGGQGPGATSPLAALPLRSAGAHACPVLPEPAVGFDSPQLRLGVGAEGAPGRLAAALQDGAGTGAGGADVHGRPHPAYQGVQPALQHCARGRRIPPRLLHLGRADGQAEDRVQALEALLHVGAAGGPVVQLQRLLWKPQRTGRWSGEPHSGYLPPASGQPPAVHWQPRGTDEDIACRDLPSTATSALGAGHGPLVCPLSPGLQSSSGVPSVHSVHFSTYSLQGIRATHTC